ncbi:MULTISPECIES: hypothetical protein [unclassified Spirosoma]|uniref:hypothetical protein n=1 Tax=unclassified Spirosoma TaxID=2621999 RepID=UPI000966FCF4|nr:MULTISPECIES: hypothetical protein [unclassified Spirosoma]MBN8824287.1 hypothetical protein [Spirosoma sp.]OJW70239.1 MAG: hypothetical protein BGO59_26600 [Spirosoma sp. 48-14]
MLSQSLLWNKSSNAVVKKDYRTSVIEWSASDKPSYQQGKLIVHCEQKDYTAHPLLNWAAQYNDGHTNGPVRVEPYTGYPFKYARPKNTINQIILHETAAFSPLRYTGTDGYCAHFGIVKYGTVLQYFDVAEYQLSLNT